MTCLIIMNNANIAIKMNSRLAPVRPASTFSHLFFIDGYRQLNDAMT
jgi:hypothetical protein